MNLQINKKHTIISIIIFIIMSIYLALNRNLFFVENIFQTAYFVVSVVTTILLCFLIAVEINFGKIANRIFSLLCPVFSIFYLFYIIELLNNNNVFSINFLCFTLNIILISMVYLFIFCISNNLKFSIIFSSVILFLV